MQAGGVWTKLEKRGKIWKLKNHVTSAITNAYPKVDLERIEKIYGKDSPAHTDALRREAARNAKLSNFEVIEYSLSEVKRYPLI